MSDTSIKRIAELSASFIKIDLSEAELGSYFLRENVSEEIVKEIEKLFEYLKNKQKEMSIQTCLRLSRLPLKEIKDFKSFDYTRLKGKDLDTLKNLESLAPLYAGVNIAFIGPQGIGKTHLAMAFGNACCNAGLKTYFLKASELNDRITDARRNGRVDRLTSSLVKPSCLIIDEVGRSVFDVENTRIFFDIVDRRYNKEGPNSMIFTSNKEPGQWGEFFREEDSLLCSLDRIFDKAMVFVMRGESYRGRQLKTMALETVGVSVTKPSE